VPSLYNLRHDGLLPETCALVGFARRSKSDEQFRAEMQAGVAAHSCTQPVDEAEWAAFAANVCYHTADFDGPAGYAGLRDLLDQLDAARGAELGQREGQGAPGHPPE
jgi:glucose-6-phosphate 1-dehydrogenase